MPQQATIYRVLVASPGDCFHEREAVKLIVAEWNAIHSIDESAMIEAVMWETHSRPDLGGRPQEIINNQIVESCDFIIGFFWTKLGTPTGVAESGTAEEIEIFRKSGKPALIYFSSSKVDLNDIDIKQYESLLRYKKNLQSQGLYSSYKTLEEFRSTVARNLAATMVELLRGNSGIKSSSTPEELRTTKEPENSTGQHDVGQPHQLPKIRFEDSVEFFAQRISKAFPGVRGLEWFNDPSIAVERLMLLLSSPLKFQTTHNGLEGQVSPIWWFRAGGSMMIEDVKELSETKILMDGEELEIKRIAVHESMRNYQCFVYVEARAENQTGLYKYTESDIKDLQSTFGYASEEYGLLNGTPIKRTEYDDGAAVINNKVVSAYGAELRVRYLTDYNFIICSNNSPFNSNKFDAGSEDLLNGILDDSRSTEELFEWMKTFQKKDYYN